MYNTVFKHSNASACNSVSPCVKALRTTKNKRSRSVVSHDSPLELDLELAEI